MFKLLFSTLITLLISAQFCSPCTCIGESTVQEELSKSDVVLVGKVITNDVFIVKDTIAPKWRKIYKTMTKLLLNKVYKGKLSSDTVTIISGLGRGDCGFSFSVDSSYIVYAKIKNKFYPKGQEVDTFLYTDICMRTRKMDETPAAAPAPAMPPCTSTTATRSRRC
jgi:hypothetical protein